MVAKYMNQQELIKSISKAFPSSRQNNASAFETAIDGEKVVLFTLSNKNVISSQITLFQSVFYKTFYDIKR